MVRFCAEKETRSYLSVEKTSEERSSDYALSYSFPKRFYKYTFTCIIQEKISTYHES